jgi:release factor glutamine methyltransferase
MPEINALVADARRRFRAAGIAADEAALDARLLAQHVLGWDAARLLTHGDADAPADFAGCYERLVARRVEREPLAYITGRREFWNLSIEVSPAVLIPRPETELLVEAALDHFCRSTDMRVLDLCTGSGCLAVALAREFRVADVVASDISDEALAVARINVTRYQLDRRVACVKADLLDGVEGPFDLIVSNPPYVPATDVRDLQPEVRRFEPHSALFAGANGLEVITRLLRDAPAALAPDGLLMFEFGAGQLDRIERDIARSAGLRLVEIRHDLQDIPRVAVVRRAAR